MEFSRMMMQLPCSRTCPTTFIEELNVLHTPTETKQDFGESIFDFYWCDICGDYCTFRSKGFRSHRVMVHRIGVQKYRTWDRFGRPFEPEDEDTSSTPQIQPKNLVEQRHLEWAVKD
ncbi:uncharacterized protein TNCV_2220411 [Trichonephila clavipes]|nr:uncharacterized protein TNCV_2220411 [Trichonephila clavipes]